MSYLSWRIRNLSALVAVLGTLGWVSSAEAIISKKRWDPKFNTQVSGIGLGDLGWSGTVDFNIRDNCLDEVVMSSMWVSNLTGGCNNALSISNATVTLYDSDSFGNNGHLEDVTLNYGGSTQPFGGDNVQLTWRMYIDVNEETKEKTLKAVQGGFLFPEFTTASFATQAGFEGAAYWLNFNANKTNNFNPFSNAAPVGGMNGDFAFLTSCSYRKDSAPGSGESHKSYSSAHKHDIDVSCLQNDGVAWPATLVPVPEPETYLLGLASFGVLGMWARRRRLRSH